MADFNRVFLIGRLARDPELRYIPSGTAVATFTVATNRAYTVASGEKREETCFVRVVAWARQAELCGQYLTKGSPVFVEGRLQSRSWETPEGQKRSTLEVVAQTIQFLGKTTAKPAEAAEFEPPTQTAGQAAAGAMDLPAADVPETASQENPEEAPF